MKQGISILIVDDDSAIREIVALLLQREGFLVHEAADAASALDMLKAPMDLIILDIMMPGRSGLELCSDIREITTAPILFLTAKMQDSDKVEGFSRGADDYVVKPFFSIELVSRVRALLRRSLVYQNRDSVEKQEVHIGDLNVNLEVGTVSVAGKAISLTGMEYQVLR